jgi:chemotaxis protein methyltransferase CheR
MEKFDYPQLSDEVFKKFTDLLFKNSGITLKEHKKYLLIHRLSKYVGPNKEFKSFDEYYDALIVDKSGKVMENFVNTLTTNWSFFFREPVHFDFLKNHLKEVAAKENYIRIWSAACSTGEEPYSMSISAFQSLKTPYQYDLKILASDISTRVLKLAGEGRYHYTKVRGHIEEAELRSYFDFDRENNDFIVKPQIKNLISFRYLNLLEHYPFNKKFDVVFLRNVLIYFDNKEKEYVINKIHEHLKPGGILILGLSESLVGIRHKLNSIKNSIYQNKT